MSPSLTLGRLCSACQAVIASPAMLPICTCLCILPLPALLACVRYARSCHADVLAASSWIPGGSQL